MGEEPPAGGDGGALGRVVVAVLVVLVAVAPSSARPGASLLYSGQAAVVLTGPALSWIFLWVSLLELADRFGEMRRANSRRRRAGGLPANSIDISRTAKRAHRRALLMYLMGMVAAVFCVVGVATVLIRVDGGPETIAIGVTLAAASWGVGTARRHRSVRVLPSMKALPWAVVGSLLASGSLVLYGFALLAFVQDSASVSFVIALFALLVTGLASMYWQLSLERSHIAHAGSDRRRVLYLRSFRDDERQQLSVAPFARPGLTSRLSLSRFRSFEEVLAERIHQLAPVVAIAEPDRTVPRALAVLRQAVDGENWQERVRDLIAEGGPIVVSLGSGPGLEWEMRTIAESDAWRRTVVVIPPVPGEELLRRWASFEEMLRESGFGATDLPSEPAWLLALVFTPERECLWLTGHAISAWGYSVAIETALDLTSDLVPG